MKIDALVLRIEGDYAIVEARPNFGGCGRCEDAGGCRSGILARPLANPGREQRLPNRIGARAGERVVVLINDGEVLRAALATYLLPVAGMILGASIGTVALGEWGGADLAAVLGGVGGLILVSTSLRLARGMANGATTRGPRLARRDEDRCPSGIDRE